MGHSGVSGDVVKQGVYHSKEGVESHYPDFSRWECRPSLD